MLVHGIVISLSQKSDIMQQKSERVTIVKKNDCHSKIVTVDRYDTDLGLPKQSIGTNENLSYVMSIKLYGDLLYTPKSLPRLFSRLAI